MMHRYITVVLFIYILFSCTPENGTENNNNSLPYLGQSSIIDNEDGSQDTLYHRIGEFNLINQDSVEVSRKDVEGKIYVADFFFTSCPTLCPKMKTQMLRVYDSIQDDQNIVILSHTIDPEYDSVKVLKEFADQLGVSSDKWYFLTGDKDEIYKLGQTSYMVTAIEDSSEPGGYIHSGAFILVDKEGHVRGVYDGTDAIEVNDLLKDLRKLKSSYEG